MQQITALVRTMGYIGSVVPFALEACGPTSLLAEPIYAMWHSCLCHNYYVQERRLIFSYGYTNERDWTV